MDTAFPKLHYGLTVKVIVLEVSALLDRRLIVSQDLATREEIVTFRALQEPHPRVGDRGTMTYQKGGRTGAYWHYKPETQQ